MPEVRNCSPVCTAVTSLVCCFVHEAASKPILSTQISKLLNPISRENVLKNQNINLLMCLKFATVTCGGLICIFLDR